MTATTHVVSPGQYSARQVLDGLSIPEHDYIFLSNYNVGGNPTVIVYRNGGASGVIVAQLTLTYDGSGNLTSVART